MVYQDHDLLQRMAKTKPINIYFFQASHARTGNSKLRNLLYHTNFRKIIAGANKN